MVDCGDSAPPIFWSKWIKPFSLKLLHGLGLLSEKASKTAERPRQHMKLISMVSIKKQVKKITKWIVLTQVVVPKLDNKKGTNPRFTESFLPRENFVMGYLVDFFEPSHTVF